MHSDLEYYKKFQFLFPLFLVSLKLHCVKARQGKTYRVIRLKDSTEPAE